ncbi:DsbA family protein [Lachnospiraceae bacterium ZAX-1]
MRKLEIFFDYECPFCKLGYEYLMELLPKHSDIEIIWKPCEAHPRPESNSPHSDLVLQALLFALDHGVKDEHEFHRRMYQAVASERQNVEIIDTVVNIVGDLVDADALKASLKNGEYAERQSKLNDYAYNENGVWFIPAFRMGIKKLDAAGGVGVTKQQLVEFLK